jgi:hypothetical protein
MKDLKCFSGTINGQLLDRTPFGFNHKLADHPALSIESLGRLVREMPSEKEFFSKSLFKDLMNNV